MQTRLIARPAYTYKTVPLGKQVDVIENSWHERVWALLCRPGTGKSKLMIDTAGLLYAAGQVDTVIVLAPNNVDLQWWHEQIPAHLPDYIPRMGGVYRTQMGKRAFDKLERALRSPDMGLKILCLSYEALQTNRGRDLARRVAASRPTLLAVDESHRAGNLKSSTFNAVHALARLAKYRRISTGTLTSQNPFPVYAQFEVLGPGLLGFSSLAAFKSMYAEMLPDNHGLVKRIAKDFKERTGQTITPQIIARDAEGRPKFRNLAHLRARLAPYSSFLTLQDVSGTEPTVLASTRVVELNDEQRALYDALEADGVAFHGDGEMLSVDQGLALCLRLQQICGGFAPSDDDPQAKPLGEVNPKLEELCVVLEELATEKVVIWCRFKAELRAVTKRLRADYGDDTVVEYHGDIDNKGRQDAKHRFKTDSRCRFFVAQVRAGGTGLDGLQAAANYMVFYSNEYAYYLRDQAVGRLARTGGHMAVNVIDLVARGTADADVARCMRVGEDVHAAVVYKGMLARRTPDIDTVGV
jgi:hypothetical protein